MILPILTIGTKSHIQHNTSRKQAVSCCNLCAKNYDQVSFRSQSSIYRFSQVDETLYRGGRPEPEQMDELKNIGITTIVDLSTERFRREGYSEAQAALDLGINYVKIPLVSGDNPSDNDINKFFEIVEESKNSKGKLFVHCLEGKERTGLMVELYKIKYGLSDAQTSINTLIKGRFNFSENPLAIPFIKDFAQTIKAKA